MLTLHVGITSSHHVLLYLLSDNVQHGLHTFLTHERSLSLWHRMLQNLVTVGVVESKTKLQPVVLLLYTALPYPHFVFIVLTLSTLEYTGTPLPTIVYRSGRKYK